MIGKAGVLTSDILRTMRSEGFADGLLVSGLQIMLEARKSTCKPPVGIAAELLSYREVERGLQNTAHLGALAILTKVQASRLDYVKIWCDIILDIKTMNPGLGLSSPAKTIFGSDFGLPKSTTLAELMQTWVIALNYGHLFGTFATERALAYHLSENSEYRDSLLRKLPPSSRSYAAECFMSPDYMRLFYGLALWRAHTTKGDAGKTLTGAVLSFLEMRKQRNNSISHGRLDTIFLKSRSIAMRDLHAPLQISSSFPPPASARPAYYASLFPGEQITGILRGHEDTLESVHLAELERIAFRDFYSSPHSAQVVLAHLIAFKHWWNQRTENSQGKLGTAPIVQICQDLFEQPKDWPTQTVSEARKLQHLTRISFDTDEPSRTGWLPAVRNIRVVRTPPDPWSDANFLVSPGLDKRLHLDVFVSRLQPTALNAIARAVTVCLRPEESVTNLPLAEFTIDLLQKIACLKENSPKAYLSPLSSNAEKDWLTIIAANRPLIQAKIKSLITSIHEHQRREELAWFAEYSFGGEVSDTPVLVCLGDLVFKDRNGSDVAQIDTFWIEFSSQALSFHFCECKTGKGGGGNQQLRKLRGFINGISEPTQLKSRGQVRVWHAEAVFRGTPTNAQ